MTGASARLVPRSRYPPLDCVYLTGHNVIMARVRTYRDLVAWQKSMQLAKATYAACHQLPKVEQFGLSLQMRRSAISIPSNIAEGFGRQARPDLLRFLRVARGSLNELTTQYELASDLEMLSASSIPSELLQETDRVLQALIRSLENVTK
jgi:four helix bundle protein